MSQRHLMSMSRLRHAVALLTAIAMALGSVGPALASGTATFEGAVLSPDGGAAQGFTVVFKEMTGGQVFKSMATGANGNYQVTVQVGGTYKLDSVLAPDGTKLAVQDIAPIHVQAAGPNRLDVKFTKTPQAPATAAAAGAGGAAGAKPGTAPASTPQAPAKGKGGAPWWHSPQGIVGIVLGTVVVIGAGIGFSNSGSSKDAAASPSTP